MIAAASDDDPAGHRHQRGASRSTRRSTTVFPRHVASATSSSRSPTSSSSTRPRRSSPCNRQIFFVTQGGYDTHQDQVTDQRHLLHRALAGPRAFYAATVELGLQNKSRPSPSRTSAARSSSPATRARSAPTTAGAATSSSRRRGLGGNFYGTPERLDRLDLPELVSGRAGRHDQQRRTAAAAGSRRRRRTSTARRSRSGSAFPASTLPAVFPLIGNFPSQSLGFMNPGGTSC